MQLALEVDRSVDLLPDLAFLRQIIVVAGPFCELMELLAVRAKFLQ